MCGGVERWCSLVEGGGEMEGYEKRGDGACGEEDRKSNPRLEGPSDSLCTLGRGGQLAHWRTEVRAGRGNGVVARDGVKALAVSSVGRGPTSRRCLCIYVQPERTMATRRRCTSFRHLN